MSLPHVHQQQGFLFPVAMGHLLRASDASVLQTYTQRG